METRLDVLDSVFFGFDLMMGIRIVDRVVCLDVG